MSSIVKLSLSEIGDYGSSEGPHCLSVLTSTCFFLLPELEIIKFLTFSETRLLPCDRAFASCSIQA